MRIAIRMFAHCVLFAMFVVTTVSVWGEAATLPITAKVSQLKAKAEKGFVEQQMELANAYFVGSGVPRDVERAAHWFEKAAQAGHAEAQNQIGYFYEAGIGVPVNLERSTHWYQLAAAAGSIQGEVNLGVAYLKGHGVAKDEGMAANCFTKAFHKGSGIAAAYLGDMYYFGAGKPVDRAQAEEWYVAGAKLHDALAAYRLGSMYSVVDDHPHDSRKATELLRASANGGYVAAMHSLGLLLVKEPKLAKSEHEAVDWLEEAAKSGNWRSSIVLGVLSREGNGTPVDYETAYLHFLVAARQGGPQAQSLVANDLRNIGSRLGPYEVAKLESATKEWLAQNNFSLQYVKKVGKNRDSFPSIAIAVTPPGEFAGQLVPLTSQPICRSGLNCHS